jgi:hypothetical protein
MVGNEKASIASFVLASRVQEGLGSFREDVDVGGSSPVENKLGFHTLLKRKSHELRLEERGRKKKGGICVFDYRIDKIGSYISS